MADLAKEESAKEVENVIVNSGIRFRSYSTLGLRDDAEFLFWFAAETVEEIQNVISKLYLTVFGNTSYHQEFIFHVQGLLHTQERELSHHLF